MKGLGRQDVTAALAVIVFYAVLFLLGITCPIKYATGVSCPGCGMTRACLSLLLGRPQRALYYHPLVWLLPIVLVLYLLRDKLPRWLVKYGPAAVGVLFCVVYLVRMHSGCAPDVVAFSPESGLFHRLSAALFARI